MESNKAKTSGVSTLPLLKDVTAYFSHLLAVENLFISTWDKLLFFEISVLITLVMWRLDEM